MFAARGISHTEGIETVWTIPPTVASGTPCAASPTPRELKREHDLPFPPRDQAARGISHTEGIET